MVNCFYHPKTEGVAACKRCMIPLCEACLQDRYCVECHKMAQYVRHGRSGEKHGDIVAQDNVRRGSLTRQLMINRLAGQVLAETPLASASPVRRPLRKKAARQEKDSRALMVLTGAALAAAFGLGAMVSRPSAQAADTPAALEVVDVAADRPAGIVHAPDSFHGLGRPYAEAAPAGGASGLAVPRDPAPAAAQAYRVPPLDTRPAQIQPAAEGAYHPTVQQAVQRAAPADYQVPALTMRAPRPGLPPQTAWIPVAEDGPLQPKAISAKPTVQMAWPIAGNTLRMTSYVKVHVTGANQVSVLNITVDGKPVAPVSQVAARNEVPIDTTRIGNGDHRLRVVAMTESGDTISSEEIPVNISN